MILASSGIVLWLLSWLKPVLMPMALAILLAFLLSPVVTILQCRYFPRAAAVAAAVVMAFTLIGGIGWTVAQQLSSLVDTFPQYEKNLAAKLNTLALRTNEPGFIQKSQRIAKRVLRQIEKIRPPPVEASGDESNPLPVKVVDDGIPFHLFRLWSAVIPIVEPFAMFGLSVVLLIFMLLRREDLRDRLICLIGPGRLTSTTKAIDEIGERVSHYLLRQFTVNVGFGIAVATGLYVIGVPYAMLWGFFAAVLRYIPYLGPWLAALLPLGLSLIVSDSWTQPLLVLALLLTLELLTNMLIEPWLYGKSIGVSEIAVILMIVFWTWLWGPVGLILGTPLTVCLVVLGKHVPSLGFFETLLGNQPALEAHASYYQRLLARDQDEASDIAAAHLDETSLSQTYDHLLIPALAHVSRDRKRGVATGDDQDFVRQATREVAEELFNLQERKKSASERSSVGLSDSGLEVTRVLVVPVHDESDEIAAGMLKNLLDPDYYELSLALPGLLVSEVVALVGEMKTTLLCIAALPLGGDTQTRLLCMRLCAHYPTLKILIGCWGHTGSVDKSREQFLGAGATQFGATLEETCHQITSWRSLANVSPASDLEVEGGSRSGLGTSHLLISGCHG
ncbi:MAG: AI-2E family transporter [Sulfuricaulis sp.]